MQKAPLSNRLHIGIFGKRNAGKSTVINALTSQDIAIVSDIPGTTTDPVYKAMEIHDLGAVVLIDTGGIDDEGPIGKKRVEKAYKVLNKADIVLLVIDKTCGLSDYEENFIKEVRARNIPVIIVINKVDISSENAELLLTLERKKLPYIEVSALKKHRIDKLREKIVEHAPDDFERKAILSDLLSPSDIVVIVAPLDMEAPKGRLKLPQVQTIRDILDSECSTLVVKEDKLKETLDNLKVQPKLVITESQVFDKVKSILPQDIKLTSFSVLYARYKGDLETLIEGAYAIEKLKTQDRVLIAEACTHHPIGDDIGKVVIPNFLNARFKDKGEKIRIDYATGYDFPSDLSAYSLIIHCGACMLNRREAMHRVSSAKRQGVAVANYGILLAYMSGILDRVVEPFCLQATAV